jgi:hypothetical protein
MGHAFNPYSRVRRRPYLSTWNGGRTPNVILWALGWGLDEYDCYPCGCASPRHGTIKYAAANRLFALILMAIAIVGAIVLVLD